ncbi:hypothetical protein Tco_0327381 [Tanacetum coccineum]
MTGYRCSIRTLEGKDHHRCLPQTGIPARLGCSDCIPQPRGILRRVADMVGVFQPYFAGRSFKKHSRAAMVHPTNRLGIGRILLFGSYLPLQLERAIFYSMMAELLDQVLEKDPGAFDGFVDPLSVSEDPISKGRGGPRFLILGTCLFLELARCHVSQRFSLFVQQGGRLGFKNQKSWGEIVLVRRQAALLSLRNSLSGLSRAFVNFLTVLRVIMTDLQNR